MMRRLALVPLVLLAGCGAAGGESGPPRSAAAADCAAVLRWHGTRYIGTGVPGPRLEPAGRLGQGVEPGCSDVMVHGKPFEPSPTRHPVVWRIRGVSPALAVMVRDEPGFAYVAGCMPRHRRRCLAVVGR